MGPVGGATETEVCGTASVDGGTERELGAVRPVGAAAEPIDLRSCAERVFVGFTRHRGPAYFDQSIHLCSEAGFSPRIRYEASTVYGVLDLVGAGLGVALVPASAAVLPIPGVRLHRLQRSRSAEVPALLRRNNDESPLLATLKDAVGAIFEALTRRVGERLGE